MEVTQDPARENDPNKPAERPVGTGEGRDDTRKEAAPGEGDAPQDDANAGEGEGAERDQDTPEAGE